MRQLLRRALAIVIALSVVLPTLGLAFAPCDGRGAAAAMRGHAPARASSHATHATHATLATHDMAVMAGHDAPAPPECAHETPARGGGDAPAACLLVAHCVGMMPARREEAALATTLADARLAPTDDTRPPAPALEIDSPPPRG